MSKSASFKALRMLWIVCVWLAACGDSECRRGQTECVSDGLIRTCVPTEEGNRWLVSQCSPTETCLTDPRFIILSNDVEDDDAGTRARNPAPGSVPSQPACVGTCQTGVHECISSSMGRYCVGNGVWQLDPCDVGERCTNGLCRLSDGPGVVQVCEPGARACASDKVAKQCDPDGSAWVTETCDANQRCIDDRCQADPDAACDKGNSCLDNKTAVRCLSATGGYRLERCEGDSYCENGRCRGSVCTTGSTCISSNTVRECVDGERYKDSLCGVNEICQQDHDSARCAPLQCKLGESACGDPRDERVDKARYFTTCVTGSISGVPEWVRGECAGKASCDPALAGTSNPCSQECTVGAQRCTTDAISGVSQGYQECTKNAEWGPIKTCNTGGGDFAVCALASDPDASKLPKAICAAPICQWILQNRAVGATGSCEGTQLRRCLPDGRLADASDCEGGVCQTLRNTVTADGRLPGACTLQSQCEDGEEECLSAGGEATPRYRTCEQGSWSLELKTCQSDALCYTTRDDQGLRHVLCGAQCSPGARRCNGAGDIEECDETGRFGVGSPCNMGICREFSPNDAGCVLECIPGSRVCAGATTVAADGFHTGTSQEIACSGDGRKGSAHDCPDGTLCRVSRSGVVLGCVQCVGPDAPGGNDEGTTDSRCDPDDPAKVQECNGENRWSSGRACSGTKLCVGPEMVCGTCTGGSGATVMCRESTLGSDLAGTTCESLGFGKPGNWAGFADCCEKYQLGGLSGFAYCK